jgi:hypothetical protein
MCLQVNFYDNIINFINIYCPNNHSDQIDLYKIVNLKEFNFNNQLNNDSRTWSNNEHSSRIDRMYFKFLDSNNLVANYEDLINFCYSDHNMVIGKIVLKDDSERIKNENLWKLNDCVLDNDIVDGKIKRLCMEIKNYYSSWYDIFITKIIKILKNIYHIFQNILYK